MVLCSWGSVKWQRVGRPQRNTKFPDESIIIFTVKHSYRDHVPELMNTNKHILARVNEHKQAHSIFLLCFVNTALRSFSLIWECSSCSINFFVACSLVGLVVLLPLNYTSPCGPHKSSHSMDSFTISNISRGSNR